MRVLQLNTFNGIGGAAIAAARLNQGLRRAGVDSWLFTTPVPAAPDGAGEGVLRFGDSLRERVWRHARQLWARRIRRCIGSRPSVAPFAADLSCYGPAVLEACRSVSVVNFHWMVDLLDYAHVLPRLPATVPLVWTLHDMNPATGGCFYARDCRAFHNRCGACPVLGSRRKDDLSTKVWRRKADALGKLRAPLTIVTPSEWLAGEVKRSALLGRFPVRCIPNGVDTARYMPRSRVVAKQALGVDPTAPVVLFAAAALDSPWKGLRFLLEAMPTVRGRVPAVQFVGVGKADSAVAWPIPVVVVGAKGESEMAEIYAAADLLVVPSEADNLPNVILEAMACGVPAVGFHDVGGIPEAIGRDGSTGGLARERTGAALADTIGALLQSLVSDRGGWERRCRERAVREYSLELQASRYTSLYRGMSGDLEV